MGNMTQKKVFLQIAKMLSSDKEKLLHNANFLHYATVFYLMKIVRKQEYTDFEKN